jgi:hypothetical protein
LRSRAFSYDRAITRLTIRFEPPRRHKKNPKTTYALGGYAVCCLIQVF